jgi:cell division protein FtsL
VSTIESWISPAAVAEPLPRKRRAAAPAKPKSKAQRRQRRTFRVRGSLVWMVVFALLLVGVVTLNVAVLQANVSVNGIDSKIERVKQENAALAARLSRVRAAPRVEKAALNAGLVPATSPSYVDLGRHK